MSDGHGDGGDRTTNGHDSNGDGDREDPFAELEPLADDEIAGESIEDLFEPVETTSVDEEALWDAVLSEEDDAPEPGALGADAVVSKHQYCKQCEFFSEPPEVACTNPGTEIEELVGVDRFRVSNCPIVARRQRADTVFPDEESG